MNNYNTSRDYELLWELAKTQDIICLSEGELFKAFIDDEGEHCVADSNNVTEFRAHFVEDFTRECKDYNLEFIIPNAWINVKDRLPEKEGKYLWTIRIGKEIVVEGYYPSLGAGFATHWQHLPEPPKGE